MAKLVDPAETRKAPSVVSIVAALTSTTIWTLSTSRTAKLRKLTIENRTANAILLEIGETVAAVFTPRLPQLYCPSGVTVFLTEAEIPGFIFESSIIAQASAAGAAPADVRVTPEVGEY